jgi:adenine-specific DNA-methyltransferase
VTKFLDQDLLPQVAQALSTYTSETLETEVYDHLYNFFRRYYSEGDFLAKRVYKPGVYAIPYEGEEVKLHWANHDQYYIKTSEYLRDYSFRLRPGDQAQPMRVHFRLADAAEGEHNNLKAASDKERLFILAAPPALEDGALVIRFEYRPATVADWPSGTARPKPPSQRDLIAIAAQRVLSATDPALTPWLAELTTKLESHLRRYTSRNTFDYFIHKDLGAFLRRELDFYIKTEVMHLDDVENESAPRVEQYLAKIKVIRRIAGKIIDFIAQLEDFQKKLWLKQKFVVETQYCVTLDRIPEALYSEIAANTAQREDWVRLFAIDEIEGYSVPLTTAFLRANGNLPVDTKWFPPAFQQSLLDTIPNIDGTAAGLLVHGENSQVISLLSRKLASQVDCIYIDPPYNTSENTFVYKNFYRHSSWVAMMHERLRTARGLLTPEGVLEVAIDDTETANLRMVLDELFGEANRVASIAVEVNPAGQNLRPNTPALSHDYCHIYANDIDQMQMLLRELTDEEKASYKERDAKGLYLWDTLRRRGGNSRPADRPGQWFPIYADSQSKQVSLEPFAEAEELLPIDPQGERRIWRVNRAGALRDIAAGDISVMEKAGRLELVKKTRMPEGKKPKTLWADAKYSATTHGTKLLIDILGEQRFSYPKSLHLVTDCLRFWCDDSATVFDFFAGSGTTAHAVMRLNEEDGGSRRFILAEVGSYFDTVILPRVLKVAYTSAWRRGKPQARGSSLSYLLKYIRLESYEDTLNNLDLRRTEAQEQTLLHGPAGFREEYLLRYMLDVETRGSQSLLNIDAFQDPTAYKLKVKRPGSDESREVNVDLLETFNWLIGLTVERIAQPQSFSAAFASDAEDRLRLEGGLQADPAGPWWFRTVTGTTPDGRRTLIIWRKLTGNPERDNLVLDEWFARQGFAARAGGFDLIYVNGGNHLGSLRADGEHWKVRLLEEDFHRLMFETEGA